jgi:hypothetical protein
MAHKKNILSVLLAIDMRVLLFCIFGGLTLFASLSDVFAVDEHNDRAAVEFISVLGDVPLMSGLLIVEESLLSFDKPNGRFLEILAVAKPGLEVSDIEAFYASSLPALGWTQKLFGTFVRQDELLTINLDHGANNMRGTAYVSENTDILVHFTLGPTKK